MPHLDALIQQRAVWRARDVIQTGTQQGLSTGYAVLDEVLYDHGWPAAGLVELLCDRYGIGELRLLMPALVKLTQQEATWVVWINPPFIPYAPALAAEGMDMQHLLLVYPDTHKEALWTLEETLLSGSCKAVLAWLDEADLTAQQIRKTQTHARQSGVWTTLFRPAYAAHKSSAAELRMRLDPGPESNGQTARVSILKRRGGWPLHNLDIEFGTCPVPRTLATLKARMNRWLSNKVAVPKAAP